VPGTTGPLCQGWFDSMRLQAAHDCGRLVGAWSAAAETADLICWTHSRGSVHPKVDISGLESLKEVVLDPREGEQGPLSPPGRGPAYLVACPWENTKRLLKVHLDSVDKVIDGMTDPILIAS